MRSSTLVVALVAALAVPTAFADPDKDESGHGRPGRGHAHAHGKNKVKEEFRDGHCKVTREWKKDGEYKEKRKCKGPEHHVRAVPAQRVVVVPPWYQQQQGEYVYRPQYRPAPVAGTTRCNSRTVGSVLGGIVGGVLGNQIGKGDGRALATVGGAVAGVLVGGEVGRRMDAADHACVGEVLEVAPAGRQVQWTDGPVRYAVVPGQVNYVQGSYCRPYTLTIHTERGPQRQQGTACRRPDGVWMAG